MDILVDLPFNARDLVRIQVREEAPRGVRYNVARLALNVRLFATLFSFTRLLRKRAERLAGRALATRALAERVSSGIGSTEIDPDDSLRRSIDDLDASLARELAEELPKLVELALGAPDLLRAAKELAQCLEAVRQEYRNLKGVIQAHDANVQVIRGAARVVATTPRDLDKQLEAATRP